MIYPTLSDTGARREFADIFAGLDVNDRTTISGWAGYGRREVSTKFSWEKNATCDKYPSASTREHRRINECGQKPRGFALLKSTDDKVRTLYVAVDPNTVADDPNTVADALYVDDAATLGGFAHNDYAKHIVGLGGNAYILRSDGRDPDPAFKVDGTFVDTIEALDFTFELDTTVNDAVYIPCDIDGNQMLVWYSDAAPDPSGMTGDVGLYWIDTAGDAEQLKKYSTVLQDWIPVSRAYIKIFFAGVEFGDRLKEGDAIVITNAFAATREGEGAREKAYNERVIEALNTGNTASHIVKKAGPCEEVIDGVTEIGSYVIIETPNTVSVSARGYRGQDQSHALTVTKTVPAFEFVCAGENRVWGCVSEKNEIRASKLGDVSNWNSYAGISTDSYAVTVGGEIGRFTGAAFAFGGPVFFKENAVIRIYGTAPSNYRLSSISVPGVASGSGRSVAVVNDLVFYLSPNGVCYYDGTSVHEIGEPIGKARYKNGVGAGAAGKYYLSCEDRDGGHHMFVYDLARNLWTREDETKALFGASLGNFVTFVEESAEGQYRMISNRPDAPVVNDPEKHDEDYETEGAFDWEFVTPVIGYESPNQKYLSRFNIRLMMDFGAQLEIYLRYDNEDGWERKSAVTSFGRKSFTIPIRPKRCDHMQIRFAGHGDCVIYSLAKIYEEGSDEVR